MADLNSTNIYGYLHVHEDVTFNADFLVVGRITTRTISLTQPNDGFDSEGITSTPPMTVVSRGWVENLNVDYLDNHHGDYYLDLTNATNYLSDDRLAVDTISLNKLKYISSGTILGRALNTANGPVTVLNKINAKPILDLIGTNRGDQAVFNKVNLINHLGAVTTGPAAVAPLSYDEAIAIDPSATLETLIGNKETLSIKSGEQVFIDNVPAGQVDNCINISVGMTLTDGILKGSVNTLSPTGLYSPYTNRQNILSLDTGNDVPYLLDRLNINAELYSSAMYITDLVMEQESANWIPNNNEFSQVLTTKKITSQINETYPIAFFSPATANKFGYEVGSDIIKSLITLDDNQYTTNNILTAKKVFDDLQIFKAEYVDSRIYGAVGNLDILLSLNIDTLEDGVLVLVKSDGIYRLSKLESQYTTPNGKYVISIPNHANAKWIKVTDKIGYHNTTGDIQGGSADLNEYYHMTAAQNAALHNSKSDNQYIYAGLGMDFLSSNEDVTITLGTSTAITTTSNNEATLDGHSHIAEVYDLEAISPVRLTDGVKVFGNKGVIRIDNATDNSFGVVMISDRYDLTSNYTAASATALKNGLASVVNLPTNGTTTVGYIPTWQTALGIRRLSTGYAVSTDYDAFKAADPATLNNNIVRADIIKLYVDNLIEDQSVFAYKGPIDCSTNPNYPAAGAGDVYVVSEEGKIGGPNGPNVEPGDMIVCNVHSADSPTENAGTHEEVGANWSIIQTNIHGAVTNNTGGITNNFVSFSDTTGRVIKNSGYNANSFQPKHIILDNLSATTTSGIMCYNSTNNAWTPRSITTAAVGTTQGITITNANGTAGNIIIQHADTSNQTTLTGSTALTWINNVELDDYGHVTKLAATVHPTTTAKTVNFTALGLSTTAASGITVIDTLNIVNDTNCHVTTLSATSKYLPIASQNAIGVLTSTDWTTFNNKVAGPASSTTGNVPVWNGTTGKILSNGYAVENTALNASTINANTLVTTNLLNAYTENRVNYKGKIDASTNPSYPTGLTGELYIISQSGKIGGVSGDAVFTNDIILCIANDATGTAANWAIYRKTVHKQRKVIVAAGAETSFAFADIAEGLSEYYVTIYKNGVFLLESDEINTFDYSLDKDARVITLTTAAEAGEKYTIMVEA